ncbi:ATPase [Thermoproteus uzoniensis 768-20]|uniref:ATPase n=1 Tax=Thermoproteus uzoniensis (strain 768-20) TaxID=999630 RepID=F2L0X5_THEU7|nr:ATP-binding protein [Thermoproteus uzoniensis]AEA12790.1 ATPase [Thermoproteus uzoniensis 768-20]
MLFSVEPKSRREDLYDFEYELSALERALRLGKLVVVLGLRRTGKTSLVKVGLSSTPHIYIDVRLSPYPAYRDILGLVEDAVNDFLRRESSLGERLAEAFRGVAGVEISWSPLRVFFKFGGGDRLRLGELFKAVDELGIPVVVAFDEAQELRRANWLRLDRLFAYIYDNLANVKILLTGSEAGLLYDFLKIDDPESPLFGRPYAEVKTRRLSDSESLDFLERGFAELGLAPQREVLLKAVELFDGIIGWLTYFGYAYAVEGLRDFDRLLRSAVAMAKAELDRVLSRLRSPRYRVILSLLSVSGATWREIKRRLEAFEGRPLNDATVADLLNALLSLGIVEKRDGVYSIADPVYRLAASRL